MAPCTSSRTPLGNLGDLSPRAAEILRDRSPVVAAEDTRRTRGLLSHLGAAPTLLSFHAHSGERRLETLLEILGEGPRCRPGVRRRHPGRERPGDRPRRCGARRRHSPSSLFPGPSAVATALSAAGLPADRYLFLGFLPRKGTERARLLARAAAEEWSVVFFEAPTRLAALLEDLAVAGGARAPGRGRPGADQAARGVPGRDPGRAGGLLFRDAPAWGAHRRAGRNRDARRRHPIAPTRRWSEPPRSWPRV